MSDPVLSRYGEICRDISNGIVRLYKEYYGRGPDRARTTYDRDVVLVLMRGGFTAAEHTLLDAGEGNAVHDQRRAFNRSMRDRFSEVVAVATGRRVVGFMSAAEQSPDLLCQIYLLETDEGVLADAEAGEEV